jgi:hypothetical protein
VEGAEMGIPAYRDYSVTEGRELSAEAFAHMEREERAGRNVSYDAALKHVLTSAAREPRRRYQDDWQSASEANADKTGQEAYRDIGNFVIGMSRQADGSFNATKAAEAVNGVFDPKVVFNAVAHVINRRTEQIASNMSPGATNANLSAATRRAIAEHPELAAIYNGTIGNAQMTAEALPIMYPSNRWV